MKGSTRIVLTLVAVVFVSAAVTWFFPCLSGARATGPPSTTCTANS